MGYTSSFLTFQPKQMSGSIENIMGLVAQNNHRRKVLMSKKTNKPLDSLESTAYELLGVFMSIKKAKRDKDEDIAFCLLIADLKQTLKKLEVGLEELEECFRME